MQKVVAAAKPDGGLEATQIEEISSPGVASMMECYEGELKRPIRNLVNGRHSHIPLVAQAQTAAAVPQGGQAAPSKLNVILQRL